VGLTWRGPREAVAFEPEKVRAILSDVQRPCYLVSLGGRLGLAAVGALEGGPSGSDQAELLAIVPAVPSSLLGDPGFLGTYGLRWPYMAGAMANGIGSERLVETLGRQRLLGSFGAAGLLPGRIEAAIHHLQQALPAGPFAFNLIHSPSEPALERRTVELYLEHGISTVEASAYIELTPALVHYRAAGLAPAADGGVLIGNRIIAKVSRREVATHFFSPAPADLLGELVAAGRITPLQAQLAARVPLADDLTAEADSAGHTDNRPLVVLLPSMIALRDELQVKHRLAHSVRVGAAGGIGTPEAVLAAFALGAAYVLTGSVNQACLEAGTSAHTRRLLAQAEMADVIMAPAADMFELGVRVQLLKRGTMFPLRAQRLYELYRAYESLEELPAAERVRLERQIFRRGLDEVWRETVAFFRERDPDQLSRAEDNPKRRMALVFRWYLGLSSRWSNSGEAGREADYQIWCGPAMGAFNDWVRGSYLEDPDLRSVVDVADHLMLGAAYLSRVQLLRLHGLKLPSELARYRIEPRGERQRTD
jgi:PfaD family protein